MWKKNPRMLALMLEREMAFYALNDNPDLAKEEFLSFGRSLWINQRTPRQSAIQVNVIRKLDRKLASLLPAIDGTRSMLYSNALPGNLKQLTPPNQQVGLVSSEQYHRNWIPIKNSRAFNKLTCRLDDI